MFTRCLQHRVSKCLTRECRTYWYLIDVSPNGVSKLLGIDSIYRCFLEKSLLKDPDTSIGRKTCYIDRFTLKRGEQFNIYQ